MSQTRDALLAALEGRWMQTADHEWHQVVGGRIKTGSQWMSLRANPAYNAYALQITLRGSRGERPLTQSSSVTVVALQPVDDLAERLSAAAAGGPVSYELEIAGEHLSAQALQLDGSYLVAVQAGGSVRVPVDYVDTLCVCPERGEP